MSRRSLTIRIFCILIFISASPAWSQEEYIYLVRTPQSTLTGFRVQGTEGIITALHGVVGAETITVMSSQKGRNLKNPVVSIIKADIELDLALLGSEELARLDRDGIPVGVGVNWETLKEVKVIGYPIHIDVKEILTYLQVRRPAIEPLANLVEPETRRALQMRKSPATSLSVLNLQGFMLPGHSGAPILDSENRVVAVANGGLRDGTVGHCWAIPLLGVRWQPITHPDVVKELNRLSEIPLHTAFRIINPSTERQKIVGQFMLKTVVESSDSTPVLVQKHPPGETVVNEFRRIGEILTAMREGKSSRFTPEGELKRILDRQFSVLSGTEVEILEVEQPEPSVSEAPGDLEYAKTFLSSTVYTKVKIISGRHRGEEVWAPTESIKSKHILAIETVQTTQQTGSGN